MNLNAWSAVKNLKHKTKVLVQNIAVVVAETKLVVEELLIGTLKKKL